MKKSIYAIAAAVVALLTSQVLNRRHPNARTFLRLDPIVPPTFVPARLALCVLPQFFGFNPRAPDDADLKGQLILLTGGTGGIGKEIAKGLVRMGADVIIASRNATRGSDTVNEIRRYSSEETKASFGRVDFVAVDMADLSSVSNLVKQVEEIYPNRKIDQLIQNSGVWPSAYSTSAQGHEYSFAANLLGPHLLFRKLMKRGMLNNTANIIITAGDYYITLQGTKSVDCTPHFKYTNPAEGEVAYSRSKLGIYWLFAEAHNRFPNLQMNLIHPGVMDNSLVPGGSPVPIFLLLSNKEGAQTHLIIASADTDAVENGAYYHNTLGRVELSEADPANDNAMGAHLWGVVEDLIADFL